MKQQLSTTTTVVIIAVVVLVVAIGAWWVWHAPTASSAADARASGTPGTAEFAGRSVGAQRAAEMKAAHMRGRGAGQAGGQ